MTPLGWLGHKTSTQTNKLWKQVLTFYSNYLIGDSETIMQILFSGKNKKNVTNLSSAELTKRVVKVIRHKAELQRTSAPASPLWRGGLPLLPFPAAPLPFLSCFLSYFNSRHKTLHFGENSIKIDPKLKMLSMFKGQCSVYSIFEVFIVEWDYIDTKHITWHMVPSFLYDHAKRALPSTPLPSNPSWSTGEGTYFSAKIHWYFS